MRPSETVFALADGAEGREAFRALGDRFESREETSPPRAVTYYDTFDWRIYRDGGTLRRVAARRGPQLVWADFSGTVRHRLAAAEVPAFVQDFPPGDFREALAPVLEMRRLLPVVELRTRSRELRLLDGEEKTVVRLRLEERSALPADGAGSPSALPPLLRALPVRGYDRAWQRAVGFLAGDLGLEPVAPSPAEILALGGAEPGGYSSKVRLELDPATSAVEAARGIHRSLLATIEANEDGVRRDLDSEFLHDFRVAVRRTRSALTQIKGVFPAAAVGYFKGEFSWLGGLTGPTRDLDVYLLKFEGYRASLPPAARRHLGPLHEFLEVHQRREQRRMVAGLDSDRSPRLLADWRAYLDRGEIPGVEPGPSPELPRNAERPVGEVGSERIWKVYRRILKRGRAIDDASPAQDLHRLRIEAKKLRYLMEFFRSLYPAVEIDRLIKALKRLQDNLGDFNDYEVQQEQLGSFARQMLDEGTATAETLMAMGRLVARLEHGQAEERRRFYDRFARFARQRNRRRFRALFAP